MATRFTDLPRRIARLPVDARGYPTPWFVAEQPDGTRDFRVADPVKRHRAFTSALCWVCGEPLGVHKIFVIGPMCAVNRVTSEPPCHRECAEFSVKACPFLTHPLAKRNERDMPDWRHPGGEPILRNPGVTCLWETRSYHRFRDMKGGWLISLGDPDAVDWWCEGRTATDAEIRHSLVTGLPFLAEMADRGGPLARGEFDKLCKAFFESFPKWPRAARVEAA